MLKRWTLTVRKNLQEKYQLMFGLYIEMEKSFRAIKRDVMNNATFSNETFLLRRYINHSSTFAFLFPDAVRNYILHKTSMYFRNHVYLAISIFHLSNDTS